jgi:hypothetical protein
MRRYWQYYIDIVGFETYIWWQEGSGEGGVETSSRDIVWFRGGGGGGGGSLGYNMKT